MLGTVDLRLLLIPGGQELLQEAFLVHPLVLLCFQLAVLLSLVVMVVVVRLASDAVQDTVRQLVLF